MTNTETKKPPTTSDWHEVCDRLYVQADQFHRHVVNHQAVTGDPKMLHFAQRIMDGMAAMYLEAGSRFR